MLLLSRCWFLGFLLLCGCRTQQVTVQPDLLPQLIAKADSGAAWKPATADIAADIVALPTQQMHKPPVRVRTHRLPQPGSGLARAAAGQPHPKPLVKSWKQVFPISGYRQKAGQQTSSSESTGLVVGGIGLLVALIGAAVSNGSSLSAGLMGINILIAGGVLVFIGLLIFFLARASS